MGHVSAEVEIDVPRERVFEAISDLATRPMFLDHFVSGYRLTRIESTGVGAGARFRFSTGRRGVWFDTTIDELEAPHRIVEHGRGGRLNRVPSTTLWELTEGPGSLTTVRASYWTEPSHPVDRAVERVTAATPFRERHWREALRRLRDLLEAEGPGADRVAVAGGNPHATGIP